MPKPGVIYRGTPPDTLRPLMRHQELAFEYCQAHDHGSLYMQMRLGKTLVSVRAGAWWEKGEGISTALVAAPLTVLEAWEKELQLDGHDYVILSGAPKERREQLLIEAFSREPGGKLLWFLSTYESIRSTQGIESLPWGAVFADESTKIKNAKAQSTKQFVSGFTLAKHRYNLCGLYAPEGVHEVVTQQLYSRRSFMGSRNYWDWRNKRMMETYDGWRPRKGVRGAVQRIIGKSCFVMTRKQAGMGSKKVYQVRKVSATAEQKALYKQLKDDWEVEYLDADGNLVRHSTEYPMVVDNWLARVSGGFHPATLEVISTAKFDELKYLLTTELANEPVLVWFRFTAEILHARQLLSEAGVRCDILTGKMSRDDRVSVLDSLRQGQIRVLLAQTKCAKYGVDVSCADTAVYYSNWYSCDDRAQSEDRIVHPTKTLPLLLIDMAVRGTVDEEIIKALQDKTLDAQWLMRACKSPHQNKD